MDSRSSDRAVQTLAKTLGRVRATGTLAATHDAPPPASGQPHSLKLLFGRDLRSQINAVTPELNGSDVLQYGGLHNFVADRKDLVAS